MYKKMDEYLSGFFTEDYWYDEGIIIAEDMLKIFTKRDWEVLLANIKLKTLEWQIRYANCISGEINNKYIIQSLLLLIDTDSDELFEACIDSLRCLAKFININDIYYKKLVIEKVNKLLPKCSVVTKKILEDFLKEIN